MSAGVVSQDRVHATEPQFAAFIRSRKRDILQAWEQLARQAPIAAQLDRPALLDHIPALLDRIAEIADALVAGKPPHDPDDLAEIHAIERLGEGFDLGQVIAEYSALRDCILRLRSERTIVDPSEALGIRALNQAIDRAVAAAVQRFTRARDRTLVALDQISAAALETRSLDELLDRLLRVLLETTAAVDMASIFLRDRDVLRVRATVGLEAELAAGWTLPIGVGFAGRIAETRQAFALESAATDPLVQAPSLRGSDFRGLFGVPMIEGGTLVGVAFMGSKTAPAFSRQDQQLFAAMAQRATSAIELHVLRDREQARTAELEAVVADRREARAEAERTLAVMDTILSASALGIGFLDTELRYVRANSALAELNGLPPEAHVGRSVRDVLGDVAADVLEPLLRGVLDTRVPVENLELQGSLPSHPERVQTFQASYVPVVTAHGELLGVGAVVIDISERKEMEEQLRERELYFRSLADNIAQLAWMADEQGALFWYNRRWYEYTGTAYETMAGAGWRTVHHPDHVERVAEKFLAHIASGDVWEDTFPLRGADGRYRWFLSRAIPIRDEQGHVIRWFGTNTDVTEQRFMHEAMTVLSSSLDYRTTLAQVAELAVPALGDWCSIDLVEDGKLTRVAVAHIDPARLARASALAARYPFHAEAQHGVPAVIRSGLTETGTQVADEVLSARASDPEYLELARSLAGNAYVIAPLIARDRTLGALTFIRTESHRRYSASDVALVEELGRRAAIAVDNARLYAEANREARLRDEMLAVVSHDLRNPLAAIELASSMLLATADLRTKRPLETVHRNARRMDVLLRDLLDMASIQAGRLSIARGPEAVDSILREVVDNHESLAREKGLSLVRSTELPGVMLDADRDRIAQVLGNLVGNALKFCRAGDTIELRGTRRDGMVELEVRDTGPGISASELPHVFQPYWSAKQYATKGTGLGLFISKGIVEAHGGRIWATSTPGQGATFTVVLPLA